MSEELKPCPFCSWQVSFHADHECNGCHYIHCPGCDAFFDFARGADPENESNTIEALREACAGLWNTRVDNSTIAELRAEVERWKERLSDRAAEHIDDFAQLLHATEERDKLRAELDGERNMAARHQRTIDRLNRELDALRGQSEWIACAERLPPEGSKDEYLIVCSTGIIALSDYIYDDQLGWGFWYDPDATHWRPLPAAPSQH